MKIKRNLKVPTGNILILEGQNGDLEALSIGDYGAAVNLNQNNPVTSGLPLLPLEEKWVITISTQYGCSMGCKFCDVPKVGSGKNATVNDLLGQVDTGKSLHPEVLSTKRLNVHFARMGEPTWNSNVLYAAIVLKNRYDNFHVHPVVSTMMPKHNKKLKGFINAWMHIKNEFYFGEAGLQLSINSTSDLERDEMFSNNALSLSNIGIMMNEIINKNDNVVKGRKITLNFAVANYEINPQKLLNSGFNPQHFIIKLTPMHKTTTALKNNIETTGDYTDYHPYEHHAIALRKAGYEVLVFIASEDEDLGRITCGNAILSGTEPLVEWSEL